jgi:hypothetical protein
MRSYWLKILLGALGVFAVGMIGVTLVRGGIAKVHTVVSGDGPITIPLGLIPFVLAGERLGNLDHVTLHRESPSRVSGVELEVGLADSLFAQGLSGCRLAANLSGDTSDRGVNIKVGRGRGGAFYCVPEDSVLTDLVEFGVAIFQPGQIEVPLLLPTDVVTELQSLDFGHTSSGDSARDSIPEIRVPNVDSIRADVARELSRAETLGTNVRRFADSIRAEARKRIAEQADPQ